MSCSTSNQKRADELSKVSFRTIPSRRCVNRAGTWNAGNMYHPLQDQPELAGDTLVRLHVRSGIW